MEDIQRLLKTKKQELANLESKIHFALQQNAENEKSGNMTTCGKCHLKLGHTKKRCDYSPCKSAKLEGNLSTAQNEIQNAENAVSKVMTSVPNQIEV